MQIKKLILHVQLKEEVLMNQNENYLKQATAVVQTEGILSEMDLEIFSDEEGKKRVVGNVTVKTGDINFTKFQISSNEFTKGGKENPSYQNILGFMERAHSIAEVGEESATRVSIRSGQLNPYTTFNDMGAKIHGVSYKTGFISIIKKEDCDPHSIFKVECYVNDVENELDTETQVQTGRVILHTLVPIYNNGIENLDIVVPEEFAMAAQRLFTQQGRESAYIQGNIGNTTEVQEYTVDFEIGGQVTETETKTVNELVLTNAKTMEIPYELETIQKAIAEYDIVLEAKRKKRMENSKKNNGNKTTNGTSARRSFGF